MTEIDFPNEAAAEAFEKARAEIARVKAEGGDVLQLSAEHGYAALTHLPKEIADLEWIGQLDLSHTRIRDDALQHIARMREVWELDLSYTLITDAAAQQISGMNRVAFLYLSHTAITDTTLSDIAGMETVQGLNLSHTQITDFAMEHIAGMKGLRTFVDLIYTKVTLEGLQVLARKNNFLHRANGLNGRLLLEGSAALQDIGLRTVYEAHEGSDRTKAVLEYARNWKPFTPKYAPIPAPEDKPPKPITPKFRTQDVKTIFRSHAPDIRVRVQNMVALIQQEEAAHKLIPAPNDPDQLDEYNAKAEFLENMRLALSDLHDDIPDMPEPELTDDQARTLKDHLLNLPKKLDNWRAYLDQDKGTYGGLYKVGLIASVGSLLSVLPVIPATAAWTVSAGVFGVQTVRLHISKDE